MEISQKHHINTHKFTASIIPDAICPPSLELNLSFTGEGFLENFEWGYLDLHYVLFDNFPESKRIILTYQDFLDGAFTYQINTGDFLTKVTIGGFFHNGIYPNYTLLVHLKETKVNICDSVNLHHLHEAILFGPTIDFLEKFRSLTPKKLHQIISSELDSLDARIDEASGRPFNFWVLGDSIVKIKPSIEISENELNLLQIRYKEAYEFGNKRIRNNSNVTNNVDAYLESFGGLYETYINENRSLLENSFPDLIIDFDDWITYPNNTGCANVWIEPKEKVTYRPEFKSPISEIELEGLLLIIKVSTDDSDSNHTGVSFEISGHYNPDNWGGRNKLDICQIGKTVVSGYSRIIEEKGRFFATSFLDFINQNYHQFIARSINQYFKSIKKLENVDCR